MKLKFEEFEIESFTTELSENQMQNIKGGYNGDTEYTGLGSLCNPKTDEGGVVATCQNTERCKPTPQQTPKKKFP